MKPQNFNDLLAFMYFPFVLVWVIMLALIYQFINVGALEFLGLGTATGVILSKFGDIYQFYFRTRPAAANPPDTTTTVTTETKASEGKTETVDEKINRITAEIKTIVDSRVKPD